MKVGIGISRGAGEFIFRSDNKTLDLFFDVKAHGVDCELITDFDFPCFRKSAEQP